MRRQTSIPPTGKVDVGVYLGVPAGSGCGYLAALAGWEDSHGIGVGDASLLVSWVVSEQLKAFGARELAAAVVLHEDPELDVDAPYALDLLLVAV